MKGALGLLEAEFKIRISLQMIYGRSALKRKGIGEAWQSKNKSRGGERNSRQTLSQLFISNHIKELVPLWSLGWPFVLELPLVSHLLAKSSGL